MGHDHSNNDHHSSNRDHSHDHDHSCKQEHAHDHDHSSKHGHSRNHDHSIEHAHSQDHEHSSKHAHSHDHNYSSENPHANDYDRFCRLGHSDTEPLHHHSHHHGRHEGHGHHHGHNHHHGPNNRKGLAIALAITSGIMLLEFFGGLATNSLALISDSGHMLSDAAALALSLAAVWFAARPASATKTYGFYRFEILAALFNALTLFVIAGFIIAEAYERFFAPPEVASGSMMLIAAIGLLANLASAWALTRIGDAKSNINVKSAYLHVLGDALGSIGAIAAGLLMLLFQWYMADPLISVIVALLILKSAWGVMKYALNILMEGVPSSVDPDDVKTSLLGIEGVRDVHCLHIWTITSGMDSLSCHLLISEDADSQTVLQNAVRLIERKYRIVHSTIQVETSKRICMPI